MKISSTEECKNRDVPSKTGSWQILNGLPNNRDLLE